MRREVDGDTEKDGKVAGTFHKEILRGEMHAPSHKAAALQASFPSTSIIYSSSLLSILHLFLPQYFVKKNLVDG